ncbi:MAG TPA: hypothetical protein VGG62_10645 [Terracidiphilus sp.]|jgi:hypothetical protein
MMTEAEHRARHIELHKALDELCADWVAHQGWGKLFSNSTIMELMQWSHEQTIRPIPLAVDKQEENQANPQTD